MLVVDTIKNIITHYTELHANYRHQITHSISTMISNYKRHAYKLEKLCNAKHGKIT